MLYLNVGGLTNMAIAEGTLCRFTRVVGGGLEAMASEIAERRGIPLVDARALLAAFELNKPPVQVLPPEAHISAAEPSVADAEDGEIDYQPQDLGEGVTPPEPERVETWALAQGDTPPQETAAPAPAEPDRARSDRAKSSQQRSAAEQRSRHRRRGADGARERYSRDRRGGA